MTIRLSASSFAGTARTLVAVGTVSDMFMFLTTAADAPRSGDCLPVATGGAAAGFVAGAAALGSGLGSALGSGLGSGVAAAFGSGAGLSWAGAADFAAG